MPTFGNTVIEETNLAGPEDNIIAGRFTMGAVAGTADSISVYISPLVLADGETKDLRCAIYTSVADPVLVGMTEVISRISTGWAAGWMTFNFPTPPSLAALTDYLLAVWCDAFVDVSVRVRYKSTTGQGIETDAEDYSTAAGVFPDPMINTVFDADGLMSIYCTYTETVAGQPIQKRFGNLDFQRTGNLFTPRSF